MAVLQVGDKLPDSKFSYFDDEGNMQEISVAKLTDGKKVVLFAVPGAFTPTCSNKHLPGFVEVLSPPPTLDPHRPPASCPPRFFSMNVC